LLAYSEEEMKTLRNKRQALSGGFMDWRNVLNLKLEHPRMQKTA
jgi:hypothetical protein